jgi:hypothetical protein
VGRFLLLPRLSDILAWVLSPGHEKNMLFLGVPVAPRAWRRFFVR